MNKLIVIGNLAAEPELRSTPNGIPVCTFRIAVNGRKQDEPATFFRITAWRQLGENCAKYLEKGKKVAVVGTVGLTTYTRKDGRQFANLEVTADEVEFLTPRGEPTLKEQYEQSDFVQVTPDDLPF